ncbi:hypothetical protein [Sodalis praecaptivus]|uniref:hypothetical protein n=1 Tax=Sodalis praecaptivus TaxID=1239307 RepID=UPI00046D1AB6|nr:hypothetical protein [Sodalis praecaptivus]
MTEKEAVRKKTRHRRTTAARVRATKRARSIPIPEQTAVDNPLAEIVLPDGSVMTNPWCFTKSLLGMFPGFLILNCEKLRTKPAEKKAPALTPIESMENDHTTMRAVEVASAAVLAAEAAATVAAVAAGAAVEAAGAAIEAVVEAAQEETSL